MKKSDIKQILTVYSNSAWRLRESCQITRLREMLEKQPLKSMNDSDELPPGIIISLKRLVAEPLSGNANTLKAMQSLSALLKNHLDEFTTDKTDELSTAKSLMHATMKGNMMAVDTIMQSTNHFPFSEKVTCLDPNNREIEATPLQYALWVGDIHLAKLLIHYMPVNDVELQIKELEQQGLSGYGTHFDVNPIISAYKEYIENLLSGILELMLPTSKKTVLPSDQEKELDEFIKSEFEFLPSELPPAVELNLEQKIGLYWNKLIAEQKKLPVFILQQFYSAIPTFDLDFVNRNSVTAISDIRIHGDEQRKFGVDFGLIRQDAPAQTIGINDRENFRMLGPMLMLRDKTFFETLQKSNIANYKQLLGHDLPLEPTLVNRPALS